MLTITNKLLIDEGKKVGINSKLVSEKHNLVLLSYAEKTELVRRSRIGKTSSVFNYIADYKEATADVLDYYDFSFPQGKSVNSLREAEDYAKKIGFPLVIKPELGGHGDGVTAGINDFEALKNAYQKAEAVNSQDVIVQKFIPGDDFRIMVVGYKVIAIAKRIPARVFGDSKSTVEKLIQRENKNPLRAKGHQTPMTLLEIDNEVHRVLVEQNFDLQSIPKKDEEVFLRKNANLSTGGEAEDVTEFVPKENIELFEKMAQALDANVVGIDVRCQDITKIIKPQDYAVIEVNASPGIRMHHFPSKGKSRNIAKAILQELFPEAFKKNI